MRTLVHLSDLHFGRVDERLLGPLADRIEAVAPDLVVVSGDLTQRAKRSEFEQARAFLDRLPRPQLVVPGNHDVPVNPITRFARPLSHFRRYIEDNLSPRHIDDEIAVLGVNSARSLVVKNGRINQAQIAELRQTLCALPAETFKIVVSHHPFELDPDSPHGSVIGRSGLAMTMFADCGVDLLLAGHMHLTHSTDSATRYAMETGYAALVVAAGTATSTRGRGERNAFNVLRVESGRVEIEVQEWNAEQLRFIPTDPQHFGRRGAGWEAGAARVGADA